MTDGFGELKRLELRSRWPHEAHDFTPWLAANIGQLSEALGIELQVEHTEVAVGPFSADIVARDPTGSYVVIENQVGRTDHDHLGKALTYAAVLGAKTIVWVAANFTEEHRKTLDWLNDNTLDDLEFFGVEPEVLQIDDSRPAVQFLVVSRPSQELRRAVVATASGELTDVKRLQLEWWIAFRDALAASKAVPSVQEPKPRAWYNVALGKTGMHLSNTANTFDKKLGVRLYLQKREGGESVFAQLMVSRAEIEQAVGSPLEWNPNNSEDKVIAVHRPADISDRQKWPEYCQWMVDMTKRFREVFAPRLKALSLVTVDSEGPGEGTTGPPLA